MAKNKEDKTRQRQAQSLPWIANPFIKPHHYHATPTTDSHSHEPKLPTTHTGYGSVEEQLHEAEEAEEATPIELFYDLYFVANLTTVTSVHYITEATSLSSYCLYFIILWFTWLHVTLLDVRFSRDSVYERACKGLHFGIMAAFASVSARWDPFEPDTDLTVRALKTMTLTLMFSRFVLAVQYLVVMAFGVKMKKAVVAPMAIQGVSMLVAGMVYLGLYFTFGHGDGSRSYIGWYATVVFEVAAVVTTSSVWSGTAFRKTHLIERMGLLTLIVLGEGIIVMLKAINTIVKGFGWTKSSFGVVVAAMAIIYFFWMLYFDMSPKNGHFGKVRQQLWTILHFPFHLGLVLSVEGLRQLSTLYTTQQMASDMLVKFVDSPLDTTMLSRYNETFELFYNDVYAKTVLLDWSLITDWSTTLAGILDGSIIMDVLPPDSPQVIPAGFTAEETHSAIRVAWLEYLDANLLYRVSVGLLEFYGIKLPKGYKSDEANALGALFDLVYQYFFVSLGAVFVLYSVFTMLSRRQLDAFDWVAMVLRWIPAGVFFGMSTLPSDSSIYNFGMGAWPIPQVCVLIFIVILADKVLNHFALKRG